MLYALICEDKPDGLDLRKSTRETHLAYLKSLGPALAFAGPFLDAAEKPTGSLVVVDAESPEAAKAIGDADPYAKAGLFTSVTVRRWNWTVNPPA
ncbi:YciI family protein [Mangrovibrevibacter kandeliae]|uniref:YciI family protein n=1 Tax=Mangrovibrevibacter kandeliae TaxID=2968473 RepID=UPI0021195D61|nr:YciI family protein [Aurantimonas sp. CSK15Z-1]MCQ8781949.1 YciI family protein [Aurantimonas sp. CSK15Z-1]